MQRLLTRWLACIQSCSSRRSLSTSAIVAIAAACAICTICMTVACEREARPFDTLSRPVAPAPSVTQSQLHPGGGPAPVSSQESPYRENAWGMSEGKRLYQAYNCSGCHANGGGGMGPPLMDDRWIYGAAPANIYQTIVEGRPNGMPAFRGKIPTAQVWMIVAYVQSMNGQAPIDVMPGRSDHMRAGTPENARRAETPKQTGSPP